MKVFIYLTGFFLLTNPLYGRCTDRSKAISTFIEACVSLRNIDRGMRGLSMGKSNFGPRCARIAHGLNTQDLAPEDCNFVNTIWEVQRILQSPIAKKYDY